MTLRRGAPGKMTSEAVAPAPTYDITRFVAADTRSAWFIGETRGLSFTPTTQHLLRCDYGSHKLVSLGTIAGSDAGTPGVGQKNARFLDSPVSAPPSAEEVLAFGLPVVRTEIHTNNDAGREYFNALRGVELHRLSDFHTERTIAVTSSTSPGNRVETNQWGLALHGVPKGTAGIGPEGLPLTGDWGMPVFDADYSHYLRSRAVTGGAELRAYDAASAVPTTLVAEPDPYVAPLGYVDSQGTALYVASDTKRLSVVRGAALFLHEPGKGPRLLARLPFVPTDRFPVFHPMLLGIVYEK
jgi:hypothetical protein